MLALDNIVGAQLALPSSGADNGADAVPGFAHVSEIADQRVQTLDKYLHTGQKVLLSSLGTSLPCSAADRTNAQRAPAD